MLFVAKNMALIMMTMKIIAKYQVVPHLVWCKLSLRFADDISGESVCFEEISILFDSIFIFKSILDFSIRVNYIVC